ncbi:MAG: DUF805 domain-containing protein [Erythrobacter sp.]
MEYMLMPIKRYADFSGRSRRKEYWMFVLFQVIVMFAMGMVLGVTGALDPDGGGVFGSIVMTLFTLAFLGLFVIPGIAVQVRRFHDQDKSGWMLLLGFIPFIGGLIVLVFMCLEGTRGPNSYGEDPKNSTNADVFE